MFRSIYRSSSSPNTSRFLVGSPGSLFTAVECVTGLAISELLKLSKGLYGCIEFGVVGAYALVQRARTLAVEAGPPSSDPG